MTPTTSKLLFPFAWGLLYSSVTAWKTFEVPHVDCQDDTPTLLAALPEYTLDSTILFKKGVHYNIWTPVKFPVLTNVEVRVEGNLSYPEDMATVQGEQFSLLASSSFSWNAHLSSAIVGSSVSCHIGRSLQASRLP